MPTLGPSFVLCWNDWRVLWWLRRIRVRRPLPVWVARVTLLSLMALHETLWVSRVPPATAAGTVSEPLVARNASGSRTSTQSFIQGHPRVVDGDTLVFGSTRVRLFGMDAFETKQVCRRPAKADRASSAFASKPSQVYACGREATQHLLDLIDSQPVECVPRGRDPFQRVVAVCSVSRAPGEAFDLGQAMVRDGWAVAFRKYGTDYVPDEEDARVNRRGVWAASSTDDGDESLPFEWPWQWRYEERREAQRRH
ncbi:hypothetical protein F1559_002324 [Cyanidiococcus yangmingshanensis]|uniref:TNase-like domain-containing protein n=1 Tax=Cyanidiococcus yangmingshanensis TaxID=2690220 RepID=A0A7J7IJG1_9RHOD|nr:hypothetical protein F1559_002324 [Cyanidiococcus yangmingshanensis]